MDIYRNNNERKRFIEILLKAKQKFNFTLYAYTLMDNHYHLLIKPEFVYLSKIMQYINGRYSIWFNWKNNRVGHLFQGRYKNLAVEDNEYLLDVIRYIHLNPVRKKIVKHPEAYEWGSHKDYIYGSKGGFVDKSFILKMFGRSGAAPKKFRKFVGSYKEMSAADEAGRYIDNMAVGGKEFVDKLYKKVIKVNMHVPKWKTRCNRAEPEEIITETARFFDVSREELLKKKGKWNRAKKAAILLIWENTTLPPAQITASFNSIHPSNLKRIILSAEDEIRRDEVFKTNVMFLRKHFSLYKTSA